MDAEYVKRYARQQVEIELEEQRMRARLERIVSRRIDEIVAEVVEREFSPAINAMVRTQILSQGAGSAECEC